MTPRTRLIIDYVVLVPVTLLTYGALVLGTGFLACGISGCGGGGYGPSFSPVQAQAGLVVCGATLLPLVLLVLRRQPKPYVAAAGAAVVLSGAFLAMALLGLGPDGCPADQVRATAGEGAFEPGAATCSGDDDALPGRAG